MTILENVPLAQYTTLGVGGPARWFVGSQRTEDDVVEAVQFARAHELPLFVLGGGSNLLVSDEGFPGLVLRCLRRFCPPLNKYELDFCPGPFCCSWGPSLGAGMSWDDVVLYAVEHGYAGIECLAGIPGDVGGTPAAKNIRRLWAGGRRDDWLQVRAFDLFEALEPSLNSTATPAALGIAEASSIPPLRDGIS